MGDECVLVGGGLAGSLAAVLLARRGNNVTILERRPDSRVEKVYDGRSVNLAISVRGFTALERAGLKDKIMSIALPMYGRQLHSKDGKISYQAYGQKGQAIWSVSRQVLNEMLLDLATAEPNVKAYFYQKVEDVDLKNTTLKVLDEKSGEKREVKADFVVGADGAFSAVRSRLQKTPMFQYQQHFITHGYKEFHFGPARDGNFVFDPTCFHIWPRGNFMLIALPNMDRSFTVTLFMALTGEENSFEALKTDQQVLDFFEENFKDAMPCFPDLLGDWHRNPTSNFITIRCEPYNYKDTVVLLGDAAHAIVPFYGQGINAGFEDCRILDEILEEFANDRSKAFPKFSEVRKENCDTISDLALEHFYDMSSKTTSKLFLLWRGLERVLNWAMPTVYRSEYSMISFSNIPYADARRRVAKQYQIIRRTGLVLGGLLVFGALHYPYLPSLDKLKSSNPCRPELFGKFGSNMGSV